MGRSEKIPPPARMRGATQESRATAGDDGKMASHGVPAALSATPLYRPYTTVGANGLPSVEEALARLSGVMQDGVEWLMAQEMAEAAQAERAAQAEAARLVALDDGANQDSTVHGEGDTTNGR